MLTQTSTITRLTKTIQDRQLDNAIRDIGALVDEVNNVVAPINQHIANTDLTITDAGKRKLTMFGADPSDIFQIVTDADVPILEAYGDNKVRISDSYYLPHSDGISGQVMITDGIGNVTFGSAEKNIATDDLTIDSSGTRVLRLGGSLSTDKFAIERSAGGGVYLFTAQGDRSVIVGQNASTEPNLVLNVPGGTSKLNAGSTSYITLYGNGTTENTFQVNAGARINLNAAKDVRFLESGVGSCWITGSKIQLADASTTFGAGATYFLALENGTAPTIDRADKHVYYSADESAGNACPHFRTELGDIIKLYKETTGVAAAAFVANTSGISDDTATFGGYTLGQIVGALQRHGLLA
jgi:hypothetical protein